MIEIDSHEKYEEKESEYFEVEFIDDNRSRVFDQKLIEHDSYILDFIEDYIYDVFAQRIEMEVARVRMREHMICVKLHVMKSRLNALNEKYRGKDADCYEYYHLPYRDDMEIIRDE